LPAMGDAIRIHGHAFEARIYAEDPARDFAPSIGRLTALHLPADSDGVRVDSGVREGDRISVHYDPMIAKLICHGDSRAEALGKLQRALADCQAAGVATNLDLLSRIATHPQFAAGRIDTGFIARHAKTLMRANMSPPARILALATLGVLAVEASDAARVAALSTDPYSPWHERDGWWLNASFTRVIDFHTDNASHSVEVAPAGSAWHISVGGETFEGSATLDEYGLLTARLSDLVLHVRFQLLDRDVSLRIDSETWHLTLPDPVAAAEAESESGGRLSAPIPGQVTAVHAAIGTHVIRGELLVVMEAMKTVFRLTAPADGQIADVTCRAGDMVEEGQVLVSFAEEKAEA